jgi:DNA modification methylase
MLAIRHAALDRAPVSGLTHTFYRYPARFSPKFAAAAIEAFSRPGDLVLAPYMGGATTIVESIARGRRAVGCDLNSLAVFIARAKTSILSADDRKALKLIFDS